MKKVLKLYHISKEKLSLMTPRIPKSDFEDQKTPRICFAPKIQGCLVGAYENRDLTNETFHVYSITTDNYYIPSKDEVADQHITGEVWIKYPVEVEYLYDIKVTGIKKYDLAKINHQTFKIPYYNFNIISNHERNKTINDSETQNKLNGQLKVKLNKKNNNHEFYNIYLDTQKVGKIGLSKYDDIKALGLGSFEIEPMLRGQGLGTITIQYIVDKYKSKYDLIYCYVDKNNEGAIRLYNRIGKVFTHITNQDGSQYYVEFYNKQNSKLNDEFFKIPQYEYKIVEEIKKQFRLMKPSEARKLAFLLRCDMCKRFYTKGKLSEKDKDYFWNKELENPIEKHKNYGIPDKILAEIDENPKVFGEKINGYVRVSSLYTAEKYRGIGLGTDLLKNIQNKYKNIFLNVLVKNVDAILFYERLGFKKIATFNWSNGISTEQYYVMAYSKDGILSDLKEQLKSTNHYVIL